MGFLDMLKGGVMDGQAQESMEGAPVTAGMPPVNQFPDDQTIVDDVSKYFEKFKYGRENFERIWYRNILYRHGCQWIIFDESNHKWRKKRLQSWIPTPVTNKFASTGERIASVLTRVEPNWVYIPASDSEADVVSAKKADLLEPVICEENNIATLRERIGRWLTYTGNEFAFSYVEPKDDGYKQYTELYSPFEVYGNIRIEDLDNHEAIIIVTLKDQDFVKKRFGLEINNTESRELGLNYLEQIAYATQQDQFRSSSSEKIKGVVVKLAIIRPNENYPEGLIAFIIDNNVAEKAVFPKTLEGEPIFPLVHFKFDAVPGSWYASTPVHDLAPKQEQRNRTESMMELIMMRMSNPVWMMPMGTQWIGQPGEPGAQLKWQSMGERGGAPQRLAGENIPSSSFNFLEQLDKDFEELANTFEAMKGQAPYSGAPNVAIETLIEQGLTRFGPALRGIAESWRQWMKIQIELYRVYGKDRVIPKLGDSGEWEIQKFFQTDFAGAINVRIESDSTVPRNEYVKQAKIVAGIESGLIDISNPLTKLKAMQKLRLEDLADDTEMDVIAAVKENEEILAGKPVTVKPFIDNPKVHIPKHRAFAMSDKGRPFMDVILKHITEHNMVMDAEANGAPMEEGANMSKEEGKSLAQKGDAQLEGAISPEQPEGA